MRTELFTKGVESTSRLRRDVERRLRYALGRFGDRVQRVRVWLEDVNGPRGGDDLRCRIEARLVPIGAVRAEETRGEALHALALATARVERGVARRVERLHLRRRGRERRR